MVNNIALKDISAIKEISLQVGFKQFKNAIKNTLKGKKFFYVNIWNIACKPCLFEMPLIDSLPNRFIKSIGYFMVSSHSDEAVDIFLKNKNIKMENFIFVNEMMDFISGIYNEIEVKHQSFPLHVVMDKEGNCLAYLFGAFHDEDSALPLINFINRLK